LFLLIQTKSAYAYLDPFSTSIVVQAIIGTLAFLSLFLKRIKNFFKKIIFLIFKKKESASEIDKKN